MNCQEFERTIIELGGGHLMETSPPAQALAHAEVCRPCAARLDRERRLTAGLQALAVEEAALGAPERVRVALRAAFDEQRAAAALPAVSPSRRWLWAAAAALLLSTIATVLWLRGQRAEPNHTGPALAATSVSTEPAGMAPEPAVPVRKRQGGRIHPSSAARPTGKEGRRHRTPTPSPSPSEESELFPLTFVARSEPAEFVQTVRVEISRSTLLLMGLPVNMDRGEGPVTADIIIGEDGVARAVRIFN